MARELGMNPSKLGKVAPNRFCRVNDCSMLEFKWHEENAIELWKKRSGREWVQDFGEYSALVESDNR